MILKDISETCDLIGVQRTIKRKFQNNFREDNLCTNTINNI